MTTEQKQVVNDLWDLWEKLAEHGEIYIGKNFCKTYDLLKDQVKAINYSRCCTELPNKMVIELSDEEMQIVSTEELIQMEKEATEFDGFEGWIVRGKAAILK